MAESPKIKGVALVTDIFGYWPSFHDAEIKRLQLAIADPGDGDNGPILEFTIHCFQITDKISTAGFYALEKHTLVHFRFRQISNLKLDGFTNQNVIFNLEIEDESDPTWEKKSFSVTINASSGLGASFNSPFPEILTAIQCDENGNALPKSL